MGLCGSSPAIPLGEGLGGADGGKSSKAKQAAARQTNIRQQVEINMSQNELNKLTKIFDRYSKGRGELQRSEFLMLFMRENKILADKEKAVKGHKKAGGQTNARVEAIYKLFDWTDTDESGTVNLTEFLQAFLFFKKQIDSGEDKLKFYFSLFDADSNGELDREEFRSLVRHVIAEEPSGSTDKISKFVHAVFDSVKSNKNRTEIRFQEFSQWVKANPGAVQHLGADPSALIATFNLYDTDGNHKLDRDEFEKMLKETNVLCDKLNDDVEKELNKFVDSVFVKADGDHSEGIELEEFERWVRQNPDRFKALEKTAAGLMKDAKFASKQIKGYDELVSKIADSGDKGGA